MSKAKIQHDAVTGEEVVHHTSVREKRKAAKRSGPMQLNLTSMIDVIFQLLIYFVVTANFMVDEGVLDATLPQGPSSAEPDPLQAQPVFIDLRSIGDVGCQIEVDGRPIGTFAGLYDDLWANLDAPALGRTGGIYAVDNPMVIRPAGPVKWQHVVAAFNAVVRARYENVSFAKPTF